MIVDVNYYLSNGVWYPSISPRHLWNGNIVSVIYLEGKDEFIDDYVYSNGGVLVFIFTLFYTWFKLR